MSFIVNPIDVLFGTILWNFVITITYITELYAFIKNKETLLIVDLWVYNNCYLLYWIYSIFKYLKKNCWEMYIIHIIQEREMRYWDWDIERKFPKEVHSRRKYIKYQIVFQHNADLMARQLMWLGSHKSLYLTKLGLPVFMVLKNALLLLILFILMTLIIASITLLERKVLSLSQRRVGPNYIGYKGRLQYIADALKLFLKVTIIPVEVNKFIFIFLPSFIFSLCYTLWINSSWGLNISICELEYNIIYSSLLSILFSITVIVTGFNSRNKYAYIASVRAILMSINLEIILGLFLTSLIFFTKSLSFHFFYYLQETSFLLINYSCFLGLILVIFFLETSRAPFDLHEAESELISGYNTEYGGFFFALYYLGEYFHFFFFSLFIVITVIGFDNTWPYIFKHLFLIVN